MPALRWKIYGKIRSVYTCMLRYIRLNNNLILARSMQWTDKGIILYTQPLGETSHLAHILTPSHGRHTGCIYGKRIKFQPGMRVKAVWRARMPEHLGTWTLEVESYAPWSYLMMSPSGLYNLNRGCRLCCRYAPEREVIPLLYDAFLHFLTQSLSQDTSALSLYLALQIILIQGLGYKNRLNMPQFSHFSQAYDRIIALPRPEALRVSLRQFWQILSASNG